MSPELQPGLRFAWQYTVPPRATVPQLYHDTRFCRDMPELLATGYLVGMMERFKQRVAHKRGKASA
jgi:fluoroacetyl-CoA thioesterase